MKTLYFFAAILFQFAALQALAMPEQLTVGTIAVQEPFNIKGASIETGWPDGENISFERGNYKMHITQNSRNVSRGACIPLFCGGRKTEYVHLLRFGSGGNVAIFPVKYEDTSSNFYGHKNGQNFNLFTKITKSERKANFRNEVEECYIKTRCSSSSYGYNCDYAVGTQTVQLYDHVDVQKVQIRFTSLDNSRTLATYNGTAEQSTEVKTAITSCRPNVGL